MVRKFAIPLILVCLAAWCAFSIGCGGSSSSTKSCTGTYDVVGDWNVTLNGTAGDGGVINTAGLALFFDSFGDVLTFPSLTGACSFTGTATLYASIAGGGPTTATTSVTGNVTSASSISGTASNSSGSAPFTLTPLSPLSGSVSVLNQSMLAEIMSDPNADIWQLTVASSGTQNGMTFSGPNTANTCTISGTFTQEGTASANLNVFDVSITFTGTSCPDSGTVNGLGFESTSDYFNMDLGVAGTYLYAIASNSATVLEIFPIAGAHDAQHRPEPGKIGRRFSF